MATAATNTKVAQLRADAQAKADEAARSFESLTAEQATTKTEIGWTVAATAAHLASGTGFTAMQLKRLKQGKATRVPYSVINLSNFLTTHANRKKPIADSATKLRAGTEECLVLLDGWTDADLAQQFDTPYFGANTYDEALRYYLVGHIDEHMGQVKRALA